MDVSLFLEILKIDSTTGREGALAQVLASKLCTNGCEAELLDVGCGAYNLFLKWGKPEFVFCTHLDTVPPYIKPTIEGDVVRGRGACDAKGQIMALYEACLMLRAEGITNFGLLLLASEEEGSKGAKQFAKGDFKAKWLLVGEPTDGKMVTSAKGTKTFGVNITGKSFHSGYPEMGESAVNVFRSLLDYLDAFLQSPGGVYQGVTYNVGRLKSDNARNVLSDSLSCEIYFRTTEQSDAAIVNELQRITQSEVGWQRFVQAEFLGGDMPTQFYTVDGEPTTVVSFGSDAPHLANFEKKMLCGPGSILVAHRDEEFVTITEIQEVAERYVRIFKKCVKEQ